MQTQSQTTIRPYCVLPEGKENSSRDWRKGCPLYIMSESQSERWLTWQRLQGSRALRPWPWALLFLTKSSMRIKSKRSARKRCSDIWPRLILAGKEISSNKEKLNVSGPLSKLKLSVSSPLYQENRKQAWRTPQKSARLPQTQKYKLVSKTFQKRATAARPVLHSRLSKPNQTYGCPIHSRWPCDFCSQPARHSDD